MYTLKIIHKFPAGTRIYDDVPYDVDEEEHYFELDGNVKIQYHFEGYQKPNGVIASVVNGTSTNFIHNNDSAYLMNDKGETVKIIHRAN